MRAIRVATENLHCRHCRRVVKRGQVALTADMPNNPITDRVFAIHVKCARNLVIDAPLDHDEEAFEALRNRIAVTGQAFPEESD